MKTTNRVHPRPPREIVLKNKRLYVRDGNRYEMDVTDVYWFCKELFTGDWQTQQEKPPEGGLT